MEDANVWAVDRIAAAELLASLREAPEAAWAKIAADAFSRSRQRSHRWAANRVYDAAVGLLEQRAREQFGHRDDTWADGYRFAEGALLARTPPDLLGTDAHPPRSKGQIVRSLFRSGKQRELQELRWPAKRGAIPERGTAEP